MCWCMGVQTYLRIVSKRALVRERVRACMYVCVNARVCACLAVGILGVFDPAARAGTA